MVGRAANLNEDQITELAKLPCGVGAVYQNEWVQPVLCKVDRVDIDEKPYQYTPKKLDGDYNKEVETALLDCIMKKVIARESDKTDLKSIRTAVIKSNLDSRIKGYFLEYLDNDGEEALAALRKLVYNFLSAENAVINVKNFNDITEWVRKVVEQLTPSIKDYSNKQIDSAVSLILEEQALRNTMYEGYLSRFVEVYKERGRVF